MSNQPVDDDCGTKVPGLFKGDKWSSENLQQVFAYVECQIDRELLWYRTKKRKKALLSSTLRFVSISFFTAGGLVPLVQASHVSSVLAANVPFLATIDLGQTGYLLIGIAAGTVLFDKYFGVSTGWIRYTTTMLALERAQMEFRLDWMRASVALDGKAPGAADFGQFLQIARNVLVAVRAHIERETQAWGSEFQSTLEELETQLKAKADEAQKQSQNRSQSNQAGAISVTVTNGSETDDGFDVVLDADPARREHGSSCQLTPVVPGDHVIRVTGTIGGMQAFDSKIARVPSGGLVDLSLTLVKAKKAAS